MNECYYQFRYSGPRDNSPSKTKVKPANKLRKKRMETFYTTEEIQLTGTERVAASWKKSNINVAPNLVSLDDDNLRAKLHKTQVPIASSPHSSSDLSIQLNKLIMHNASLRKRLAAAHKDSWQCWQVCNEAYEIYCTACNNKAGISAHRVMGWLAGNLELHASLYCDVAVCRYGLCCSTIGSSHSTDMG